MLVYLVLFLEAFLVYWSNIYLKLLKKHSQNIKKSGHKGLINCLFSYKKILNWLDTLSKILVSTNTSQR